MKVDVLTETVIDRPLDEVADYVMNPGHAPEWYANIVRVRWETPEPLAVGSRLAFEARFLGRTLAYTYEIVVLEPRARLVMRTAQGPFPMETTYEFEPTGTPTGTATRMRLRNRGEPAGFAGVAAPAMRLAMRRANTADLAALKRLLEAGQG